MTKEQYYSMCEELDEPPIEENIPIEIQDLPYEVQQALSIYYHMRSDFNAETGFYLGKNYNNFGTLCDIFEVEDRKFVLWVISVADSINMKLLNKKKNNISINNGKVNGQAW